MTLSAQGSEAQMLVAALFWFLAVIHFLPAAAGVAPSRLSKLYGIDPGDRTLLVLLQHRATLLGLVGAAAAAGALVPALRVPVLWGVGASMLSFLLIAAAHRQTAGSLRIIVLFDIAGLIALAAILCLIFLT